MAVAAALSKPIITQGPKVQEFERELALISNAAHCLVFNSATSALIAAYSALGVTKGSRVWTTAVSFVATPNAARTLGAEVTLFDIDPHTFNLNISRLESALDDAYRNHTLPDVLAIVDLGGLPEHAAEIARLKSKFGFLVLKDASHSLGSRDSFGPIGGGACADVTVFSFHALKNITTGEGGAVTTDSDDLFRHMALFRSHGVTKTSSEGSVDVLDLPFEYDSVMIGQNLRMTEFQAALGISQLRRLERFIKKRNRLAAYYKKLFRDLPIRWQATSPEVGAKSAYHLFIIRLEGTHSVGRRKIVDLLAHHDIETSLHYKPLHLLTCLASEATNGTLREAEAYGTSALSLPLHTHLKKKDIRRIANLVRKALLVQR